MKLSSIVISGLALVGALSLAPFAAGQEAPERGFAPSYVGVGATTATNGDVSASEVTLFGAYRTPQIDQPITVRGYLLPVNGVEGGADLSYDFGVAENTNVFPSVGFVAGAGEVFPTLGLGGEYLIEDANMVVNGSYRRAFGEADGFNLFQLGVGYQF